MTATVRVDSCTLSAAALLLRMGATEVYLFGSSIKDGLRADSDVDLAVIGLSPAHYFSAVSRTSDLLGRPVDLVDLNDSTPIVRHLLASGELHRVA